MINMEQDLFQAKQLCEDSAEWKREIITPATRLNVGDKVILFQNLPIVIPSALAP